jgi:hypothetical protein
LNQSKGTGFPIKGPPVPIPNKLIFPDVLPCMNWINLNIATLSSPEFVGSDPEQRATWLCLLAYCCLQENGGRIVDCREWKDRRWQQMVRVTAKEAQDTCDLWQWDGNDLVVEFYPVEKQREIQQKRDNARTNGASGGRPRKNQSATIPSRPKETNPGSFENPTETDVGFSPIPTLANSAKAEENRKERNGREGEEARECVPSPSPPLNPVVADLPAETPAERGTLYPLDRITAQLAAVWPSAPRHMTGAEMHALHDSLRVLNEFTDDDWTASRAWIEAPNRVRGCALWPRSRSEFVSNSGEAIEPRWWP